MANPLDEDKLEGVIRSFLDSFHNEAEEAKSKIEKKTLDPIIFALDYSSQGAQFDWRQAALSQTLRKTREGRIGHLHQELVSLVPGWRVLPQQNADPDLVCDDKKLIVELKTREDTVKGSNLTGIYDDLLGGVTGAFRGYVGLYAYILNKNRGGKTAPRPFTPPDNKTKQSRPEDKRILQVDGRILWAIAIDPDQKIEPPYSNFNALFEVYDQVHAMILKLSGQRDQKILQILKELSDRSFVKPAARRRDP